MKGSERGYISRVVGRQKRKIVFLLLGQMIVGITGVIYALLLREAIDAAVAKQNERFGLFIAIFIGLVVLQLLLRSGLRLLDESCRSTIENRFKRRLFESLLQGSYSRVAATHSGEWMNRLTSDTSVVADGVTSIVPGVAGLAVRFLGALVAMLMLEPRFVYLAVPGGLVLFALTFAFRKVMKRLHKSTQEADGRMRMYLQESLGSLMVVKTFVAEEATAERSGELMEDHRRARMRRTGFSTLSNLGFGIVVNAAYVIGVIYCGYGILSGTVTYGTMTAILQLVNQVQLPMVNISAYLPKYYSMIASAERLMEAETALEQPRKLLSTEEVKSLYAEKMRAIGLEDVHFAYPSDGETDPVELFDGLSLRIEKGKLIAFTGESGCGKSTVLKLFLGLYEPSSGSCYIELDESRAFGEGSEPADGPSQAGRVPLTREYGRLCAYVPQGNHLMSGTIREVVAFGEPESAGDTERLKQALTVACAEFVFELKDGLDTPLGERGAGLSEGQMQRLAVARALFTERPVLILDEATSALDEATEKRLLSNLRKMTDRTVLIVTHRPAALAVCDGEVCM